MFFALLVLIVSSVFADGVDLCLPEQFKQVGHCYSSEFIVIRHVYWDFIKKRFRLNNLYSDKTPTADYFFMFADKMMYIWYPDSQECKSIPFNVPMTPHCPMHNASKYGDATMGSIPTEIWGSPDGKIMAYNPQPLHMPGVKLVPFSVYFPAGQTPNSEEDFVMQQLFVGDAGNSTVVNFFDFVPAISDDDFAIPPQCLQ